MAAIQSLPFSSSTVTKAYYRPTTILTSRPTSDVSWSTPHARVNALKQNKQQPLLCSVGPADSTCDENHEGKLNILQKYRRKLKAWCDKQSLPVAAPVYFVGEAPLPAAAGFITKFLLDQLLLHRCFPDFPLRLEQEVKPLFGVFYPLGYSYLGSPFIVARSYVVIFASSYGLIYTMNRLRGKKEADLLTIMVVGFCTPVLYSLIAGMRQPIIMGLFGIISSLMCGLIFKALGFRLMERLIHLSPESVATARSFPVQTDYSKLQCVGPPE